MKMVAENSLADMYNGKILYCMTTQIITFDVSSKISEGLMGEWNLEYRQLYKCMLNKNVGMIYIYLAVLIHLLRGTTILLEV